MCLQILKVTVKNKITYEKINPIENNKERNIFIENKYICFV